MSKNVSVNPFGRRDISLAYSSEGLKAWHGDELVLRASEPVALSTRKRGHVARRGEKKRTVEKLNCGDQSSTTEPNCL